MITAWQRHCNVERPHRRLDYQTPQAFYQAWLAQRNELREGRSLLTGTGRRFSPFEWTSLWGQVTPNVLYIPL
ncbi:MAG: hypothetical protein NVSMB42_16090 [Herpetosiphon sp.]